MPNLEQAIRERAFQLWIADGRPEGHADIHWLRAQREILAAFVAASARLATTAPAGAVATTAGKKRNPDRGYAWRRLG